MIIGDSRFTTIFKAINTKFMDRKIFNNVSHLNNILVERMLTCGVRFCKS